MRVVGFVPGRTAIVLWLACWLFPAALQAADPFICVVCGEPIVDNYYGMEDAVTGQKSHVCKNCEQAFPDCFVCSLPANTNSAGFTRLSDGRVLCSRDAKTAVLQSDDGLRISREIRDTLDRLFSRFTTFPQTNVAVKMVDRVHLMDLFKLAGNDYQCPNVWGYTQTKTNHNRIEYQISLMTGLPLSWFQATCAHEYSHTWVSEHISAARKETLGRDAEEGFCELISFLLMDSWHDEAQKAMILRNAYTRGQIDLFVDAERTFGINEVFDWMQLGTDAELSAAEPGRLRNLVAQRRPSPGSPKLSLPIRTAQSEPDTLMLKAIFWDQRRPLALINNATLGPNEEAQVRVAGTNVLVHCLSISPDSVRVQVAGAATNQTLKLKGR